MEELQNKNRSLQTQFTKLESQFQQCLQSEIPFLVKALQLQKVKFESVISTFEIEWKQNLENMNMIVQHGAELTTEAAKY